MATGYTFKGFFTGKNGTGKCYYTPYMASTVNTCDFIEDTTLYAYWVDEVKPTVTIIPESSGWTNSNDNTANGQTDDGYKVIFTSSDKGSGIANIKIYRQYSGGGFELIGTYTDTEVTITELKEGIIRYKAIATDKVGNVSVEKYCTIYYDKTSPKILDESTGNMDDYSDISGNIYATDFED